MNFRGINLIGIVLAFALSAPYVDAKPSSKTSKSSKSSKVSKSSKKSKSRVVKANKPKPVSRKLTLTDKFKQLRGDYNASRLQGAQAWAKFSDIEDKAKQLPKPLHASMYQIQSDILMKSGYPVLSSIYAAEAIKMHPDPASDELSRAWANLKLITRQKPLQMLTEDLAEKLDIDDKAPHFKRDWNYFKGNAFLAKGNTKEALNSFGKLRMDDRYYLASKYQKALVYVDQDKPKKAISELKGILTALAETRPNLNQLEKQRVWDLTNLALGRLSYQEEEFNQSIVYFRNVTRGGEYFYDSLFEQSWAFFMAGYPSHALGTLHGVESPFYADVFNPEAAMLKSIVLYWMCRYEDSRNALADFMENHSKTVESLGVFLNRQRLSSQTAYQLFEDMVSGVSADSLGIPRDILQSAAEQDRMMLLRDQYAHAYYEMDRLGGIGVNGNSKDTDAAKAKLKEYISSLKNEIGNAYIVELKDMKQTFDRLYDQAQFLYIELLMSEKEQILGRELHGSNKLTASNSDKTVKGWGKKTVSWNENEKNEFWWDEIGYHIYDIQPQCGK